LARVLETGHMLRTQDIIVRVGRAVAGDFMEIEHVPTGIKRHHPPPLGGPAVQKEVRARFLREIEAELVAKGLVQYIDDH
jgi:hypothetical protein